MSKKIINNGAVLGRIVAAFRTQARLTQQEFALIGELSQGTLASIEIGRTIASVDHLLELGDILLELGLVDGHGDLLDLLYAVRRVLRKKLDVSVRTGKIRPDWDVCPPSLVDRAVLVVLAGWVEEGPDEPEPEPEGEADAPAAEADEESEEAEPVFFATNGMILGRIIAALRAGVPLTQQELAEQSRLHGSAIASVTLDAGRTNATVDHLVRIEKVFRRNKAIGSFGDLLEILHEVRFGLEAEGVGLIKGKPSPKWRDVSLLLEREVAQVLIDWRPEEPDDDGDEEDSAAPDPTEDER